MQQAGLTDTPSEAAEREATPAPKRVYGLDALRGLSILAMILSSAIPYGTLPAWMYHAQDPPPTHVTDTTLPGITWVDLVFPFFLFTMGAAIPLALTRRLEKGAGIPQVVWGIMWRGALLAAFALYRQHVAPNSMSANPTAETWLTALGAMALVFVVWGKFPKDWNPWRSRAWHAAGWILAIVLLASIRYPDGGAMGPSVETMRQWVQRVDIIILVLANVSVFGSLIWLATRRSWWARLAPAGLVLALKISSSAPGWTQDLWAWSPVPWLYRMEYLKYLMIVVPGTIVGDMLLSWMRGPADREQGSEEAAEVRPGWGTARMAGFGLMGFAVSGVLVVGLFTRHVLATTLVTAAMLGVMALLARDPVTELERILSRLFQWGAWWLALGLCFEPFEGGIKKSATTISYMFVPLGAGILMLAALMVLIDGFRGRRATRLLVETGQNPLLAYIGYGNLIMPLWALSTMAARVDALGLTPWQGAAVGASLTLVLALFTSAMTRLKVFVGA